MTFRSKLVLVLSSSVVVIAALWVGFVVYVFLIADGYTARSDSPLESQSVSKLADPKLPDLATDLFFIDHVEGLQVLERFIRFRVPRGDLDGAVDELVADWNRQSSTSLEYKKQPLGAVPPPAPRRSLAPADWWRPSHIRDGYFRGEPVSFGLQIWADRTEGVVYVHQTD